jgi:hypothetical protein
MNESETIENRLLMLADMPSESSDINSSRPDIELKNPTPAFSVVDHPDHEEYETLNGSNQYEFLEKI